MNGSNFGGTCVPQFRYCIVITAHPAPAATFCPTRSSVQAVFIQDSAGKEQNVNSVVSAGISGNVVSSGALPHMYEALMPRIHRA
jgi:hypothetical protein